jgi:hypothetical protein
VQTAKGTAGPGAGSVSANWGTATTAGNFLALLVAATGTSAAPTFNTPTSFTAGAAIASGTQNVSTAIYYWAGASSQSGAQAVTIANATNTAAACIELVEYSGVVSSNPSDKIKTNSGSSASPDSGTTATTSQAKELWLAVLGTKMTNGSFNTPTNGFTIQDTVGMGSLNCTLGFLDKVVSATGTADGGATASASANWAGCINTFKAV